MIIVKNIIFSILFSIVCLNLPSILAASTEVPYTTDNRIRTYVFNENEVFLLTLASGFQSSIVFSKNERVNDIVLGDTYAWEIKHLNNRMFLKTLENNVRTNMTIMTNKRTYQFELVSIDKEASDFDSDLNDPIYVLKFSYPKNKK